MNIYTIKDQNNNNIKVFSITNNNNYSVHICEFGASLLKFIYPTQKDVIFGPKNHIDTTQWAHFGSICGRVAGRISNASITIKDTHYGLEANQNGVHHLHGGNKGFSKQIWQGSFFKNVSDTGIQMKYFSHHREAGYPANLNVTVQYILNNANELILQTSAVPDDLTVVNLTNHVYWNLNGVNYDENATFEQIAKNTSSILSHQLKINADNYYEIDSEFKIPTGQIKPVHTTPLDFTYLSPISAVIKHPTILPFQGYDHVFQINDTNHYPKLASEKLHYNAQLSNQYRTIEQWSTCPALVLYTSNKLKPPHLGVCLESQFPPGSIEYEHFPDIEATSYQPWHQTTIWRFS